MSVLLDITLFISIVLNPIILYKKVRQKHPAKEDIKVARHYALNLIFSFWTYYIVLIYKIFAGIRWSCKPSRNNYVPYYRWTLTNATVQILSLIPQTLLTFCLMDDSTVSILYFEYLLVFVLYVVQIITVELQMRYID